MADVNRVTPPTHAGDIDSGFRILADAMPQLVWTANSDATVDYFNAKVERYGGWTAGGGTFDWQRLVHPEDLTATGEAFSRAVALRETYEFEHRLLMVDGTYRWHLSRAVPMPSSGEQALKWFGTSTDVHSQKIMEERSVEIAHVLQNALLPRSLPVSDRFVLASGYRPASNGDEVGGDWYDAVVDGDRLTVVIGDAAGHDIVAATTMGAARHAVATAVVAGKDPAGALTVANDYLTRLGGVFVTCAVVQLDLVTGAGTIASAGHLPPVLMRADGSVAPVDLTPSTPLGVAISSAIASSALALSTGDTLVLFTDGLIERRGRALDVSLRRLCDVLEGCPGTSADAIAQHLLGRYDQLDDDVALLVVRLSLG